MRASPDTIGPYRILGTIGRGGMGVVYAGEHVATGERAAIKTVLAASEDLLSRFRREMYVLASIRHPGVVRVLDGGVEDGLPWYAMELLEGVTLREYARGLLPRPTAPHRDDRTVLESDLSVPPTELADASGSATAPAGPAPEWPRLLPLLTQVRRLCTALGYVHGEGIVHRDLKPDNVIVTPEGSPVLVDFGIVARFSGASGRETLEAFGHTTGTLAYAAPEQLLGQLVDARADLYALGCVLFEIATGRVPFTGAPTAVVSAHLNVEPTPPSAHAPWLPAELDELILGLLAKSPRDRIGHADAVAAVLGALGAEDGPPGPPARPYLYQPELAGREEALERLESRLPRTSGPAGGVLLVGGESGVGKTRLMVELSRGAAARGTRVLLGECLPSGAGSAPLAALAGPLRALADRCRERGHEETERVLGKRAAVLAAFEPGIAALTGVATEPTPAELPPEAARLRVFRALAETFAATTAGSDGRPLLLVADDVQWADELTLGFLEYVTRTRCFADTPVLLACTYRSEEVGDRLRAILATPGVERCELDRLGLDAVAAIAGDMLALHDVPHPFASFLSRNSEGNPFFVAEYLRAALEQGLLERAGDGGWRLAAPGGEREGLAGIERIGLPSSLRDLITRRLAGLPRDAAALVAGGAALGREFREDVLERVSSVAGNALLGAVEELRLRRIFEDAGPGRLRFTHDKLREVAYDALEAGERRALHGAAATALEPLLAGGAPEQLAPLGRHWEEAGHPKRARGYYLAAARALKARYLHSEAERLYRAFLRLASAPARDAVDARCELACDILRVQGRLRDALVESMEALEEASQLGDREAEARCLMDLGNVHWQLGELADAERRLTQALAAAREAGCRALEGRILNGLSLVRNSHGEVDAASDLAERALAIHREVGNRQNEGITLTNLALVRLRQGRLDDVRTLSEQALAFHREVGNRVVEAVTLANLGSIHLDQGRLEEAYSLFEEAIAAHREVGNRRSEAIALTNLGRVHLLRGELKRARRYFDEALALHREVGNRAYEARTLSCLARTGALAGDAGAARALVDEALEIVRDAGQRQVEGWILIDAAMLARRRGDLEDAAALIARAETILEQVGDLPELALCHCERGLVEVATGRPAASTLARARAEAAALNCGSRGPLGRALADLERACAAS